MQCNAITKHVYQGENQVSLSKIAKLNEYKSDEWVTFLQARSLGLNIIKGSHGVSIFKGFGSFDEVDEKGKVTRYSRPVGFARVFNLDQCEKMSKEVSLTEIVDTETLEVMQELATI